MQVGVRPSPLLEREMGCEISESALHLMNIQRASFFLAVEIVAIFATGARQSSEDIRRIRGRWLTRKLWSMASLTYW